MRILNGFKRELSCTDFRISLLSALAAWVLGGIVLLISGAVKCYSTLCRPNCAPSPALWLSARLCFCLLMGLALGLILGRCTCNRRFFLRRGIIFWCLCFGFSILWQLFFFGFGWEFVGLIWLAVSLFCGLTALSCFANESLLAALLLLIGLIWTCISFLLSLLIILWN